MEIKINNLYEYTYKLIRDGKCAWCGGDKILSDICIACKGTGKPSDDQLKRAEMYDKGICCICLLPMINEKLMSSDNDCLNHVIQYTRSLEDRIRHLELKTKE